MARMGAEEEAVRGRPGRGGGLSGPSQLEMEKFSDHPQGPTRLTAALTLSREPWPPAPGRFPAHSSLLPPPGLGGLRTAPSLGGSEPCPLPLCPGQALPAGPCCLRLPLPPAHGRPFPSERQSVRWADPGGPGRLPCVPCNSLPLAVRGPSPAPGCQRLANVRAFVGVSPSPIKTWLCGPASVRESPSKGSGPSCLLAG